MPPPVRSFSIVRPRHHCHCLAGPAQPDYRSTLFLLISKRLTVDCAGGKAFSVGRFVSKGTYVQALRHMRIPTNTVDAVFLSLRRRRDLPAAMQPAESHPSQHRFASANWRNRCRRKTKGQSFGVSTENADDKSVTLAKPSDARLPPPQLPMCVLRSEPAGD